MISNDARFVVWPGMGAMSANMNYVVLEPGEANVPHHHDHSEDVVFIVEGEGSVMDHSNGRLLDIQAGDSVFIPPGLRHGTLANKGRRIVSVGGPTPPDMDMLRRAGLAVRDPRASDPRLGPASIKSLEGG
jgi:mannose-6-phosphate isomerase-like protein (cupin superfamily)